MARWANHKIGHALAEIRDTMEAIFANAIPAETLPYSSMNWEKANGIKY